MLLPLLLGHNRAAGWHPRCVGRGAGRLPLPPSRSMRVLLRAHRMDGRRNGRRHPRDGPLGSGGGGGGGSGTAACLRRGPARCAPDEWLLGGCACDAAASADGAPVAGAGGRRAAQVGRRGRHEGGAVHAAGGAELAADLGNAASGMGPTYREAVPRAEPRPASQPAGRPSAGCAERRRPREAGVARESVPYPPS